MKFKPAWYDSRANGNIDLYSKKIEGLYGYLIKELSKLSIHFKKNPEKFSLDHPLIKNQVQDIFSHFRREFQNILDDGTLNAWTLSHAKNDKLLEYIHKQTGIDKAILNERYQYGARNLEAYKAFQNRTAAEGIKISGRVWDITLDSKKYIQEGISLYLNEGSSAASISRKLRQYLNNPNKIPKGVNPGRGIYRSPQKNALRLTRTEINTSYREADHLRWSQMDFVVGIEIRLSNNPNHCPLCAKMVGKYPKGFRFAGWHPQCRCFAIPMLMTTDELARHLDGERITPDEKVTQLPVGAKEWYSENKRNVKKAKSIPLFIQNNGKYFK